MGKALPAQQGAECVRSSLSLSYSWLLLSQSLAHLTRPLGLSLPLLYSVVLLVTLILAQQTAMPVYATGSVASVENL